MYQRYDCINQLSEISIEEIIMSLDQKINYHISLFCGNLYDLATKMKGYQLSINYSKRQIFDGLQKDNINFRINLKKFIESKQTIEIKLNEISSHVQNQTQSLTQLLSVQCQQPTRYRFNSSSQQHHQNEKQCQPTENNNALKPLGLGLYFSRPELKPKVQEPPQTAQSTFSCPICPGVCATIQGIFRHIVEYHNVKDLDVNLYCPYCDYRTQNCRQFVEGHLLRAHMETDAKGNRFYADPFQKAQFTLREKSALHHYIRSSSQYTRLSEQCMLLKQQDQFEYRSKETVLREKHQKQLPFVRGKTEVKYTQFGLQCPVCNQDGFERLKLLATHLKNVHRIRYPNNFFCPDCKSEYTKATELAEHLLREHSREQDFVRFYTIKGCDERFQYGKQLAQGLQQYMAYYTFFNPQGPQWKIDDITDHSSTKKEII